LGDLEIRVLLAGWSRVSLREVWQEEFSRTVSDTCLEAGPTRANVICELIEEAIASGVSEDEAIAEAVVELNIDAQSFAAANKRITTGSTEPR